MKKVKKPYKIVKIRIIADLKPQLVSCMHFEQITMVFEFILAIIYTKMLRRLKKR